MVQTGAAGMRRTEGRAARRRPGRSAGALRLLHLLLGCAGLALLGGLLALLPTASCWGLCLLLLLRR